MFGFLRRKCCAEDKIEKFDEPTQIECKNCGCMVAVAKIKTVERCGLYSFSDMLYYYCTRCAPSYDEIIPYNDGVHFFRNVPAHQIEVHEDGKVFTAKQKAARKVKNK